MNKEAIKETIEQDIKLLEYMKRFYKNLEGVNIQTRMSIARKIDYLIENIKNINVKEIQGK